ncbi:hypothetical protein [Chamaesiphon polymorphus]|nr:hypothetical protein [Chamaesiphon polymorphus]
MNIKNISLATISTLTLMLLASNAAHAQRFVDIIGNPPYGSDPINGVVGSGATPGRTTKITFAEGVQSRINAVSANLTAASVSGTQTVGANSIEVDPSAAATALAVINAPLNSNPPERDALVVALGGGIPAQQLAQSMVGLRSGDGSIDPVILTGAVSAYNNYITSLARAAATQSSTVGIDGYLRSLPPGQKAAQAILGRLLAAAR